MMLLHQSMEVLSKECMNARRNHRSTRINDPPTYKSKYCFHIAIGSSLSASNRPTDSVISMILAYRNNANQKNKVSASADEPCLLTFPK